MLRTPIFVSLLLAAALVPGAARAEQPSTLEGWVAAVGDALNATLRSPIDLSPTDRVPVTSRIKVAVNADGTLADVRLAERSRWSAADREALRAARALRSVPPLPQGLRGTPRTVVLQVDRKSVV